MNEDPEINLLRREVADAKEQVHQAISLAAAANVRLDALAAVVANLQQCLRQGRAESKTITEVFFPL